MSQLPENNAARERSDFVPFFLWLIWVVWLPFFVPALVELFQAHFTLPRLILILVGVALFFVIYLRSTWLAAHSHTTSRSGTREGGLNFWYPIAALIALSAILPLVAGIRQGDWLNFFIFTSGFVGSRFPIVRSLFVSAALVLLNILTGYLLGLGWLDIGRGILYIVVVGLVINGLTKSLMTWRELRLAREEIARLAITAERLRIARDLHDLLGHNLSLITLKSELAGRLLNAAPERAAAEIKDIEQVARTTLQEVREAVASYRQPTLANELHAAQEILAAAGVTYHYDGDERAIDALPPTIEAVLAWAVREGVTNVVKHSRAHECRIHMMREAQVIGVEVIDDGQAVIDASSDSSSGLRGLRERVAALGGAFEAGPRAAGGFHLVAIVPVSHELPKTSPIGAGSAHRNEERSESR